LAYPQEPTVPAAVEPAVARAAGPAVLVEFAFAPAIEPAAGQFERRLGVARRVVVGRVGFRLEREMGT